MPSYINIPYICVLLIMFYCYDCQHQEDSIDDRIIIHTIEKLPVHTEVVNLRRRLLPNNLSANAVADFSLAKRDEFPYMFFLINHSSRGILTIRKEIDRDELCRLRRCRCDTWCDLELEIFVNSEQFSIEFLIIRIIDKNDHSPQFLTLNNQLNLTIVENAPIGAMIKLEPAIDYDQGLNGIIDYSIVSTRFCPFSLRFDLTRGDLSLVVDENLDRELIASYNFDIIAYDGGNQTGLLHVYINIDDVNDSPPKFVQATYTLKNISENIAINSTIVRVKALDDDEGINGEITYHLINKNNCFDIDAILGDIRVTCLLDYERKTVHKLEVEARDEGEGSKSDFCTVMIYLIDENDNFPIIDFYPNNNLVESNTLKIFLNESLPTNSLILSLTIYDRDSGDNGRVTWKIDRTLLIPFELIRLTETTGELRTKYLLDREYMSEYYFTIEANDHGKARIHSTRLNINIIIIDENDNAPKFRQENPNVTINEHIQINNSIGYEVYQIQADDFDENENSEIIYSILNRDQNSFEIDSKTGIIRALVEFDQKRNDTYVLNIEARDKGSPSLSSTTTITFIIVPRNEYTPTCNIDNNSIALSIMENVKSETIVSSILCHDFDIGELNTQMKVNFKWFLEENEYNKNKSMIPFEIKTKKLDSFNSTIQILLVVNGPIDRELISKYFLFVTVSDYGNPSRSTNISYSIEILDQNDNCPQLHIETSFIMINRDLNINNFYLHLIASDNDRDSNGQITFELSSSTSPSFIHLLSNGTLIVDTNSTIIQDNSLVLLHIQIRDHGQPTPCLIVETLRLFIGTNRTDWATVIKNNNPDDGYSLNLTKRMSHAYSTAFTSRSFLHQHTFSTRKQILFTFIGLSIAISVVILTIILCFSEHLNKKTKNNTSYMKTNGIINHSPYSLINGKRIANSSPIQTQDTYVGKSPTHNYTSLKSLKPDVIIKSSSSPSSSSTFDSTLRTNFIHYRTTNSKYFYVPIERNDDLTPVDYDDDRNSGVELMMTTV